MKIEKSKSILLLQGAMFFYSFVSVMSKIASTMLQTYGLFSIQCISAIFIMIMMLGMYALIWQKSLKKIELSIAYANKGMVLLWSLLWSLLFFKEEISVNNVIGILLISLGSVMVNEHE